MSSLFSLPAIVSEFKCSIKLAVPLIASELIYGLNSFIATIMVAHLGPTQLAANALVWSIYIAVIVFFIGLLFAVSVMCAQSFGARDNIGVGICYKQGLIVAIISSLPMMLIMYLVPVILTWVEQDPAVVQAARPFFYSLIWSMLPLNVWIVSQQFLVGITKTRLVMFMNMLAVPVQVFFFYAFLFGRFGMPELGLAGIGWGMAVSDIVLVVFVISYIYFSQELQVYRPFKHWWKLERKFLIELVRTGLPLGLTWCSEVVFFAIIAIMMGMFGVVVLAAYQISYQYLMIALVVLFGTAQAAAIRVGNEVGNNNRKALKLSVVVNLLISFAFVIVFSLFYVLYPQLAIGLDIDVNAANFQEIFFEAKKFLPVVALLLIIDCVRWVGNGALRGIKDTRFQLLISVFGFWLIAFPSVYILGFKLGHGGLGLWWGIIIGLFITGILTFIRFYRLADRIDLVSLVTRKD